MNNKVSPRRVVGAVVLMILAAALGVVAHFTAGYYSHLAAFSQHVRNREPELARVELNNLKWYYGKSKEYRFGWAADRWLFADSQLHEASYQFLIGDYNGAIGTLKDRNDWQAYHLAGIARFRYLKGLYREAKTDKERAAVVQQTVNEAGALFKSAVEASPEFGYPDPNFDDRWNYDRLSTPQGAEAALKGPDPPARAILRRPGGQPRPGDDPSLEERVNPGGDPPPRRKG